MSRHISSSIANFSNGLAHVQAAIPVFFGMYHLGDFIRFVLAPYPKGIFWCGSDAWRPRVWDCFLRNKRITHWCENMIEQTALAQRGIEAKIQPRLFDDPEKYQISYKHSARPHVYVSVRPGRELEYGLGVVERIAPQLSEITFHVYGAGKPNVKNNIVYHGEVAPEQFDEEIKNYQSGLRLNERDGFSEVTAKSILLGQYPITNISYPKIWCYSGDEEKLISILTSLKYMKIPNPARAYWVEELTKPLA